MQSGSSTVNLTKVEIKGNRAYHYGGGIYNSSGTTTLTNCMVTGNEARSGNHGGVYNDSTLRVYSSTIAGSHAGTYGGGIFNNSGDTATITNGILWDNTAGGSGNEIYGKGTVTYSDVEGGFTGTGNINSDPLFVLPDPVSSGNPKTTGDYHIQSGSPVIDQGSDTDAPSDDIDGDTRTPGAIDMGADEYVP